MVADILATASHDSSPFQIITTRDIREIRSDLPPKYFEDGSPSSLLTIRTKEAEAGGWLYNMDLEDVRKINLALLGKTDLTPLPEIFRRQRDRGADAIEGIDYPFRQETQDTQITATTKAENVRDINHNRKLFGDIYQPITALLYSRRSERSEASSRFAFVRPGSLRNSNTLFGDSGSFYVYQENPDKQRVLIPFKDSLAFTYLQRYMHEHDPNGAIIWERFFAHTGKGPLQDRITASVGMQIFASQINHIIDGIGKDSVDSQKLNNTNGVYIIVDGSLLKSLQGLYEDYGQKDAIEKVCDLPTIHLEGIQEDDAKVVEDTVYIVRMDMNVMRDTATAMLNAANIEAKNDIDFKEILRNKGYKTEAISQISFLRRFLTRNAGKKIIEDDTTPKTPLNINATTVNVIHT